MADTLSCSLQNEQRVYLPTRDAFLQEILLLHLHLCTEFGYPQPSDSAKTHTQDHTTSMPFPANPLSPMNFLLLDSSDFVASSRRIHSRSQAMRQSHAAYAPAVAEKQRCLALEPWHQAGDQDLFSPALLPHGALIGPCLQSQGSKAAVPCPASAQTSGMQQRLLAYLLSRRVHTRCLAWLTFKTAQCQNQTPREKTKNAMISLLFSSGPWELLCDFHSSPVDLTA